ncbi:hypothetical protein BRADI_1g01368v3 [Brachypodium distachyon]|uniref:non-specific serine/threonine protein kinase n=1 Tax=Brachypodium distachyon TaxID=15368 RepID=A0A0Q3GLM9_BRADI|nr:hypothetical protein BRADI_1g01368v3 [Brachypodium distachyon]
MSNTIGENGLSFGGGIPLGVLQLEDGNGRGSAHGLAFALSSTMDFVSNAHPGPYLGLTNIKSNGNGSNQVFAVELDTIKNPQFADNHVGIDVNSMVSVNSNTAGYYTSNAGKFSPLRLASGEPMQVWVDYDGISYNINVSLAPYLEHEPRRPLLSSSVNLTSMLVNNSFYAGFSSSTGLLISRHYIIGRSFNTTGKARSLNYTALSQVIENVKRKARNRSLIPRAILVPVVTLAALTVLVIPAVIYVLRKKAREDVKAGMKEFIAEIMILGHLRHRNLVQLLGYSRHKSELLLVSDCMPNGSLDRVLYGQDGQAGLDWVYRFNIIKGIASGLFYLHEDWEKVVIHRDIKTSNVLLDTEMNARIGDFDLARLHNHGTDAQPTHLAGTRGYIAPELARLGRATKATDVFAFGVVMLEVACGRHPIERNNSGEPVLLTYWVLHAWESGAVLTTVDPRLEDYILEEVELVLKLGLLCSHSVASARPSMRLVLQYLEKDAPLRDLQPSFFNLTSRDEGFDQYILSCLSIGPTMSVLSGGR